MLFFNARILTESGYITGGFKVGNGRFSEIVPGLLSGVGRDLSGAKVIPGLVDIHTHGNSGEDFSDGSAGGLKKMAEYYAAHGITSFAPTSAALPYEALGKAFQTARIAYEQPLEGSSRIAGIHMEGPFFRKREKEPRTANISANRIMRLFLNCITKPAGLSVSLILLRSCRERQTL